FRDIPMQKLVSLATVVSLALGWSSDSPAQSASIAKSDRRAEKTTGLACPPSPGGQSFSQSPKIEIGFQSARGSSSVDYCELWYTTDRAKSWTRWEESGTSPEGKVTFEAPSDGLYGFYLILHNDAGGSAPPPEAGMAPHDWVCVDREVPAVQLLEVRPDRQFAQNREVNIRWTASDDNLPDRPCALYYRSPQTTSFQLIAD